MYICCFVDAARDYILAKVFEICASGSLLLYMNFNIIQECEKLGFIDGINYISCTQENFIEKVNWILNPNNINLVNSIRLAGYELIKQKHTYLNRYNELLFLLENENNNDTRENTILYFGTLIRKKGLLELPHIFNEVYKKNIKQWSASGYDTDERQSDSDSFGIGRGWL